MVRRFRDGNFAVVIMILLYGFLRNCQNVILLAREEYDYYRDGFGIKKLRGGLLI